MEGELLGLADGLILGEVDGTDVGLVVGEEVFRRKKIVLSVPDL